MNFCSKCLVVLTIAAAAMTIQGCAGGHAVTAMTVIPRGIDEVQHTLVTSRDPSHPRVALVLGGGGLRGYAHIGVLSALEELGIRPDIVVGTSAGAVVGAAYASGLSPMQIREAAFNVKISSLIDLAISTDGLMRGDRLAKWIDSLTNGLKIEDFPRQFAAVATDLNTGKAVLIDTGNPGVAVQASAAVPGANIPVSYKEGYLIDGGVTSLVPVRFARAMGADIVIAVDVYCQGLSDPGTSAPKVLSWVLRQQSCLIAKGEMAEADFLVSPMVVVPGMNSNETKGDAIQEGYLASIAVLKGWDKDPKTRNLVSGTAPSIARKSTRNL